MASVVGFYLSALGLIAPMVVCAGIGLYWGKKGHPFAGSFVTMLVTSVAVPMMVFHSLVTTLLDNRTLTTVAGGTLLALALCFGGCALVLRLLGKPVRTYLQTAAFPNSGNLGLPMSKLAFGDAGLSAAIAFFAVCSFAQNTVGVRSLPGTTGTGGWRTPVLLAAVLAVACRAVGFVPPAWVLESSALLGSLAVPMMLLSLGHALSSIPSSGLRHGGLLAGLRLGMGLVCGLFVVWLLDMPADVGGVILLQMSMPCAVLSYMYARRYTESGDVSAGAVMISTLVFLLISPALLVLVGAPGI